MGGDIHMILAEEPYPADFDAVVFIGYPVWAATLPQAVRTFSSEYDFSGKTGIPFCTHDGLSHRQIYIRFVHLPRSAQPGGNHL